MKKRTVLSALLFFFVMNNFYVSAADSDEYLKELFKQALKKEKNLYVCIKNASVSGSKVQFEGGYMTFPPPKLYFHVSLEQSEEGEMIYQYEKKGSTRFALYGPITVSVKDGGVLEESINSEAESLFNVAYEVWSGLASFLVKPARR